VESIKAGRDGEIVSACIFALNWAEDPEAKAKRLGVGKCDRGDIESEVVKSVSTSRKLN
jgi:hypothetical protein